ncbi:MAG: UDP-N-acetylmuramoyl-L-alanine--D-glutamate ligase [Candidatus Moraniibacteriota bacterium]
MMTRDFFKGKRVTVFGLGVNSGGVGTVEFLAKQGVKEIIVTDIKTKDDLASSLTKLSSYKNITYILGQHRPEDFSHVDLVIKNPLISWTNDYIQIALKHKVPVEMDSSIFMEIVPKVPILGVTGTKGKTTTATLLAYILEKAGKKVVRIGIGQTSVLGKLDQVTRESVVVFELSSWRLSALARIEKSPTLAIITNLYPDHLNYYKSMEVYARDKEAIISFQKEGDIAIFNASNEFTQKMSAKAKGKKYFFGLNDFFDDGVFLRDGLVVFRFGGKEEEGFPYSEVKLLGKHNQENVLAAALAARVFGLGAQVIRSGIASFPSIEHRLELVREKDGVHYVNDTAATIPDAAIAALDTLDTPIILLAGGSDKKLPLENFAEKILSRTKSLILFKGEATEKLRALIKAQAPERDVLVVENMEGAVLAASRLAEAGDTVLLSPGAASFGMFQNEFDRGVQFKKAVQALGVEN